jgi:hypothetical protein
MTPNEWIQFALWCAAIVAAQWTWNRYHGERP